MSNRSAIGPRLIHPDEVRQVVFEAHHGNRHQRRRGFARLCEDARAESRYIKPKYKTRKKVKR